MISVVALSALCVAQWVREADVRGRLREAQQQHGEAVAALAGEKGRRETQEREVVRLTKLQQETAEALRLAEAKTAELAAQPAVDPAAVAQRNAEVTAQNEAMARQNEQLKKLTAERDDLVRRLNERTKEWNELVRKTSGR
ncbi:MAG: hypothetical protein RLZZ179_2786 [Verrucomicrobiota bacterium]|jgi:hypothetical protein